MKKINLTVAILLLMAFLPGMLGAQQDVLGFRSRIIESWDGPDASYFTDTGEPVAWEVRGSRYAAENRPRMSYAMKIWPRELMGIAPENPENLGVLGINAAFTRQGYNQIELIPGIRNGEEFTPKDIPLPGRVQAMDFWVWGGYYDYYVEFHIRDRKGVVHVLNPVTAERSNVLGSIQFIGWKNMYIRIPTTMRLPDPTLSLDGSSLRLAKIVFSSRPNTHVSNFYVYLDHIAVISDIRKEYYDGISLSSKKTIEDIWGTGE